MSSTVFISLSFIVCIQCFSSLYTTLILLPNSEMKLVMEMWKEFKKINTRHRKTFEHSTTMTKKIKNDQHVQCVCVCECMLVSDVMNEKCCKVKENIQSFYSGIDVVNKVEKSKKKKVQENYYLSRMLCECIVWYSSYLVVIVVLFFFLLFRVQNLSSFVIGSY